MLGFAPVDVASIALAVLVCPPGAEVLGLFVLLVGKEIQFWSVLVSQAHVFVNLGVEPLVFGVWLAAQIICSCVFLFVQCGSS